MTMLSNETVRKLHEMRLGVMAEAFSTQLEDVQFQSVSFEDRFAMLVDAEWSARKSNRLTRLIRNAGYADPAACVENIEYHPERRLDQEQILRLASCTYLQEAHNVIILGATGAGKTYLACALGMAASRSFYSVRYIRLPDLLVEISVARTNGTYRDYMKKLKKDKLLILDEWLLYPLKEAEARDVLELVEARNKVASTIFCSQYDTSEWHENLYDPTLADASATGSSTMPIPSKSRESPCASARASLSNPPAWRPGAPRPRPPCTILRNGCTLVPVSEQRWGCLFCAVRV